MPLDSDEDLVRHCILGTDGAHEAVLGRFQVRLFSFILRLVGNETEAEDLCQMTFLKAFDNLESYDAARPLVSWLFGIAHNTVIDFIRARKPEVSLDESEEPLDLEDERQSLDAAARSLLDGRALERVFTELPPLYREVAILRHAEDLDYAQIADILQLPEGTVKIRLFRARKLLKDKLAALGYAG